MSAFEVRLFAGLADHFGHRTIRLQLPHGETGAGLLRRLADAHPDVAELLGACRVAVDREFADLDTPLSEGAEIALIPPVSGG